MRAKLKSELLSFEAIVLYVIIAIIFIFGVSMCLLYYNNEENYNQESTTEQTEKTVETIEIEETTKEEETGNKLTKENKKTTETKRVTEVENTTETSEVKEKEDVTVEEPPELVSLGEFRLTAYCKCSTCCGKWAGSPTASGAEPKANHTIAVDTGVIPFGTKVMINGATYIAEDTGSAIKGNRIDIYMNSHNEAMEFGVQYAEVFVVNH